MIFQHFSIMSPRDQKRELCMTTNNLSHNLQGPQVTSEVEDALVTQAELQVVV